MATNPDPLVPVSTFIEALAGVLSDEEQAALAETLSIPVPQGVAPGDLITADLFNTMLLDLQSLTARVAALETATDAISLPPAIELITPPLVRAGREMTVIGQNLDPSRLQRISIGDTVVPLSALRSGSNNERLIFDAPAVAGIQVGGSAVSLSVSNEDGTAQSAFLMEPGVSDNLAAQFEFRVVGQTPSGPLQQNTEYTIDLEVFAESSHEELFTFVPLLSVSPSNGWQITITDGAAMTVPITAGTPRSQTMQITLRTGSNNGSGAFTIQTSSTNFVNFAPRESLPIPTAVGTEIFDTPATINFGAPVMLFGGTATDYSGGAVRVVSSALGDGSASRLSVPFSVEELDTYDYQVEAGSSEWDITIGNPTEIFDYGPGSPGVQANIVIRRTSSSASDSDLTLTITGRNTGNQNSVTIPIQIVSSL